MSDTEAEMEKDMDSFASQMKDLKSDLANLKDVIQNVARRIREDATTEAQKAGERVYNTALGTADDLSEAVKEQPLTFTFGALGIGFILGWLIGGRR